jgi:mannose-1-phosphate guanylyltransferase/mannose-6-phosphate isomerase
VDKAIVPVILSGGEGSRLWPLSRKQFPKQFLEIFGDGCLFDKALRRSLEIDLHGFSNEGPTIVTNARYKDLTFSHLAREGVSNFNVLLEPEPRNTAPSLTLAALSAIDNYSDAVLVVFPSDHVVEENEAYKSAIQRAIKLASAGEIVLLGILPTRAETGYGYIRGSSVESSSQTRTVIEFIEKPSQDVAIRLLNDGGYFWNSGILVVSAQTWLKSLAICRPDIYDEILATWRERRVVGRCFTFDDVLFSKVSSESIDYAVLERATKSAISLRMIDAEFYWSDLGGWNSVLDNDKNLDDKGNYVRGQVALLDTTNSIVFSTGRFTAALGVDNLCLVETGDSVLVASRDDLHKLKKLAIDSAEKVSSDLNCVVHRPWGWYMVIDQGAGYCVKKIHVFPGGALSLQRHEHRSEHWVVVDGDAVVHNNGEVFTLSKNESTFIPANCLHRLSNPSESPLSIVEVQVGNYLGEDDIIRVDDVYGRHLWKKI